MQYKVHRCISSVKHPNVYFCMAMGNNLSVLSKTVTTSTVKLSFETFPDDLRRRKKLHLKNVN